MTSNLKINPTTLTSVAVRQERRQILKAFWLAVTILFLVELYTVQTSVANIAGAILIAFAALLPIYLWCSGSALGIPIFPIFTLTYLWTYALPLLSEHPDIINYPETNILFASLTVAGFLGLATFIWFQFVKLSPPFLKSYRVLGGQNSDLFFLTMLIAGILFNISSLGGWLSFGYEIFTIVRAVLLGVNILTVFVLSYRCGTRQSSATTSNIFFSFLFVYIITNAASLLLIGALSIVFIAAVSFTLGRQKVPWLPIILVLIFLLPLHYGKGEMRKKYWSDYNAHFVQPWDYPAWYAEWIGYSFNYLTTTVSQEEEQQSFIERASLIHLLLLSQAMTPTELPLVALAKTPRTVPYLSGATYALIPQLLVPRILNKNKIASHEGTHLLSIHYGLQNRAATLTTTIGWGLLNEAYANFGLSGCAGLAIILGAGYGQATRWSMNTPMLSSRSLFGVLIMSYAFETEFSAGVYIAALFQSLVPLVVITFVLMKVHRNQDIQLIYPG